MSSTSKLRRFAITGGIGSGKSTAVKCFNELGIPSIDADAIARKLREPGQPAYQAILQRFSTSDRTVLRTLLSQDPQAKRDLEAILHPLIQKASEAEMQKIETDIALLPEDQRPPFLLYEAALIIEAGRAKDFDGLIVVTCPDPLKIQRVQSRDQVPPEAAEAMIRAQMSDPERLKHAHYQLDNSGTPEQLKEAVRKLLDQLKLA
jgi:dephospho-CoA kinase